VNKGCNLGQKMAWIAQKQGALLSPAQRSEQQTTTRAQQDGRTRRARERRERTQPFASLKQQKDTGHQAASRVSALNPDASKHVALSVRLSFSVSDDHPIK
jgi:hypothetical protein